MDNTKGEYSHFDEIGQFVYNYWCSLCGIKFQEPTPEVSAPVLCHTCYTGRRDHRRKELVGRK